MNFKTCEKGHFYDGSSATCPYCEAEAAGQLPKTMGAESAGFPDMPSFDGMIDNIPSTVPTAPPDTGNAFSHISYPGTTPSITNARVEVEDYHATEAVHINGNTNCDPIVGWLVCVKGPNRGKDYRLHNGSNFIGSGKNMDVCIENDKTISTSRHASISYDDKTKSFFIEKGEVRNLIYVNDAAVRRDSDLKIYDKIEIGNTVLVFIPLCGEDFSWQEF